MINKVVIDLDNILQDLDNRNNKCDEDKPKKSTGCEINNEKIIYGNFSELQYKDGKLVLDDKFIPINNNINKIVINGNVSNIVCVANVDCDNVNGNVTVGGNVNCDDIGGNVNAGGNINCDEVKGSARANGNINIR